MRGMIIGLRVALGLMGLAALAVGAAVVPPAAVALFTTGPGSLHGVGIVLVIGLYVSLLGFLFGLVSLWRLLNVIAAGAAFSPRALARLRQLAWAVGAVTLGIVLWLPFLAAMTQLADAPGLLLFGVLLLGLAAVIGVFVAIMVKLWQAALASQA